MTYKVTIGEDTWTFINWHDASAFILRQLIELGSEVEISVSVEA